MIYNVVLILGFQQNDLVMYMLYTLYIVIMYTNIYELPRWCQGKESGYQCRRHKRPGFDPWVRKIPWSREWQPTPVFLLGNPMNRGAWWARVLSVTKSQTWLSDWIHTAVCVGINWTYVYINWIHSQLYI